MSAISEATDVVRRKWRSMSRFWEQVMAAGLIMLTILPVAGLALWFMRKLAKSLTAGGFGNWDLYIPRVRGW